MVNSDMLKSAAAAELALKTHVLQSSPGLLVEMTDGHRMLQEIADRIDLTESPEDAVCSLVLDLLRYCEREKIDWTQDVISRASKRFRRDRACKVQKG
jgi:hypothetical protein